MLSCNGGSVSHRRYWMLTKWDNHKTEPPEALSLSLPVFLSIYLSLSLFRSLAPPFCQPQNKNSNGITIDSEESFSMEFIDISMDTWKIPTDFWGIKFDEIMNFWTFLTSKISKIERDRAIFFYEGCCLSTVIGALKSLIDLASVTKDK